MGGRGSRAFRTNEARKSEAFFGLHQSGGMFNQWRGQLTPEQLKAVIQYTGASYARINTVLRDGALGTASTEVKECINNITEALNKFDLKKSLTVFRGASGAIFGGYKTADEINAMARAGARIKDLGFVSTSASSGAQFSGSYKFIITVPAGKGRGAYVAPVSHYRSENEFLLQRGSTFKIVKAVDAGHQTEVYLRLEPQKKKKK